MEDKNKFKEGSQTSGLGDCTDGEKGRIQDREKGEKGT